MTAHVVVIGGGVVGVTSAAVLASRGLNVTLLERQPVLGSGATAGNGGQLSYCYSDALASPAILSALPRLLLGLDPSFRICPSLSAPLLAWGARFLGNCTHARFAANTHAVLRLALRSRVMLDSLCSQYPRLQFSRARCGKIHIYQRRRSFEAAKRAIALKNKCGCGQRAISRDELLTLEPALALSARPIAGGLHSPSDEAGNSREFAQALGAAAASRHALTVLTGVSVQHFITSRSRVCAAITSQGAIDADFFVVAAGCESSGLVRLLGLRLPIVPMKGYSVTLPAGPAAPTASITDTSAKIVYCRLGAHIRIAGMAELGRADLGVTRASVDYILSAARASLPGAARWNANPNAWAGLRPMTPDSRPIISDTCFENLFLNCGHGMLGWTLACGSADLLAHLILEPRLRGELESMKTDFSFARFQRLRGEPPERHDIKA